MVLAQRDQRARPESPERRAFLRQCGRTVAGAAATLVLAGFGQACTRTYYARTPERAVELGNSYDSLSAAQLGFTSGETSLEDAVSRMQRQGLTHIAQNINVSADGGTLSVLTADFQHSIHIFRNRRYEQSVRLAITLGELPQRYELRVADYSGGKVIMALVRDAVEVEPPRLALIPYSNGVAGTVSYVNLREMERNNGGMQNPIFVGYDLNMGITFMARDRNGVPWENGYIISWDGSRLSEQPVPFMQLMKCDCIRDWAEARQ
jgi:hypothetical protein